MIRGNKSGRVIGPSPMVKGVFAIPSLFRAPRFSWRRVLSVGVVLAYLVLAGEAIHCQYLPTADHTAQHESSNQSPPKTSTHATHCLLANHASATIATIASLGVDTLPTIGFVQHADQFLGELVQTSYSPARAPPLA